MKNILLALLLAFPFSAHAKDSFRVDSAKSTAEWEGRKIGGAHHGTVKIKGGELTLEKGALTGGHVDIDMSSLKDEDLTDADTNAKLVNHLRSDDFFSVEKYPVANLKITKVEKGKITGDLTIKGITHPVTFPADVKVEKNALKAKGTMEVDRTLYEIRFRSAKFFANLGDKVIKDIFTVKVDLTASK